MNRVLKPMMVSIFLFMFSVSLHAAEGGIVRKQGQLRVDGTKLVSQSGDLVILRGMSLFWSQWMGNFYNEDCVEWLAEDWHCTLIRAAMGVEHGGYLEYPDVEIAKVSKVVDACIDLGIYVIVDWHDHRGEAHVSEAVSFFSKIAEKYGDCPNVIYEIYNEPLQVSWSDVVKPYADTVIAAIREIDPDNLIIVGTPTWSQDVDSVFLDPLMDSNVLYALHFYAGTHLTLRSKALTAIQNGLPLFVSEFGTCNADGNGDVNVEEMEAWMQFMEDHGISWCNWSIADKAETSAALSAGASPKGGWKEDEITLSGKLIKNYLQCNK